MNSSTLQRTTEALFVKRLQQVIERMGFESLDRVVIVGSRKDNDRSGVGRNLAKNSEAVNLRHLDVEKRKIRLAVFDGRNGLETITALRNDLDVTLGRKQASDSFPG